MRGSTEYLKSAVMTATPEQLQIMLLDGCIRFAQRGREAILAKDFEASFESLDRAQKISLELSAGLNRDANPDIAEPMQALFTFVYRRLVEASVRRDVIAIDDAVEVLRHQRETWQIIQEKVGSLGVSSGPKPPQGHRTVAAADESFTIEG
ncbi:Flagellar protein FliS [Phycisphaerae bacterium RAS1]|nr:Flagellar protein FliS [Phycisphaerae bacterium RAS1]